MGVSVAIQKAEVGHQKGNQIAFCYSDVILEYSTDNGENFYDVISGKPWATGITTINEDLFSDRLIIRNKNTKEIIYESPKIGEFEVNYIYENGKTTATFNVNGSAKDETSYTYAIDNGEPLNGNTITVVEDTSNIKLKAYTNKEFVEQTAEAKEIQVKVITVEKPKIEIDNENNLILTEGSISNDKLGNIYYSIDHGEEKIYTDKVKLSSGKHIIKAYQVSEEHAVKSNIETIEVTIKEQVPESNPKDNDLDNNLKEDDNNHENNGYNENNEQDHEKQDIGEQENSELKIDDTQNNSKDNIPKTGDNILIYMIVMFSIFSLNLVIKNKIKRK